MDIERERDREKLFAESCSWVLSVGWSEWLSIYWGWQVKFSADGVMPAGEDHLNSSHTLQISKLIVYTERSELGNVLDSSAKTAI